jgi:hypothetical protein
LPVAGHRIAHRESESEWSTINQPGKWCPTLTIGKVMTWKPMAALRIPKSLPCRVGSNPAVAAIIYARNGFGSFDHLCLWLCPLSSRLLIHLGHLLQSLIE